MKKIITLSFMLALLFVGSDIFAVENSNSNIGGTTKGEITKSGTTGANFLKIDVGARGAGMGGAYGAVVNDLSAVYWNAAGLADINAISVECDYSDWFGTLSHTFFGVGIPVGEGYTVGLGFISYGAGDIPVTTVNKPEGTGATYNINDMMLSASFGGYLTNQFSFGLAAKFLYSSFANVAASGVVFDVGTMYDTELYGIKLGFAIQNIGTEQNYSGQDLRKIVLMDEGFFTAPVDAEYTSYDFSTPLTFRASVSSEVISNEVHKLIVASDFLTVSDQKSQVLFGAEYTWKDLISFRSGYRINHDQIGYSGGIGLKYLGPGFGGRIDYSITPTTSMGVLNRLSVAIDFGG